MPKSEAIEQKPIYIPRNVYVPVIRPVFVPRERIIVKPQIIHVARPVLVDRPVPVQQKPIVIERDRPIPVRVETVEKVENIESSVLKPETPSYVYTDQVISSSTDKQYTTIDYNKILEEADRKDKQYSSSNLPSYNYETIDFNKYLQETNQTASSRVLSASEYERIINEANRQGSSLNDTTQNILNDVLTLASNNNYESEELKRKQELQQLVNEVDKVKRDLQNSKSSIPSYTLEVFDSTVSDKFERVDQNSLKNLYGLDTYTYYPSQEFNRNESTSQAYPSQNYSNYNPNDYYTGSTSAQATNEASFYKQDSYKSLTQEIKPSSSSQKVNANNNNNNASGVFNDFATPVGTITNVTQLPSQVSLNSLGPAPVVIQNVQKMIQNFGGPAPYTVEPTKSSSNLVQ